MLKQTLWSPSRPTWLPRNARGMRAGAVAAGFGLLAQAALAQDPAATRAPGFDGAPLQRAPAPLDLGAAPAQSRAPALAEAARAAPQFGRQSAPLNICDLTATYGAGKGLHLTAGVKNLLDKEPRFNQGTAFQKDQPARAGDPAARAVYVSGGYAF